MADCTATAIRETLRDPALAGTYHLVASGETSCVTTPAMCLRWRAHGRAGGSGSEEASRRRPIRRRRTSAQLSPVE
ncbi:hypothetical protein [Klebsiella pneumoniae]|uniref:hypothetical protein n=1 Tax=Klebsiella pneumoniae TaxID=573 RepID=UPI002265DD9E|nr:hypothetical protein [Klebsiella pneumoniae]